MGEQKNTQQQDVNQLLQVRREKLAALQEAGKDPFQITKYDVTHHSQEIRDHYDELEGNSFRANEQMTDYVVFWARGHMPVPQESAPAPADSVPPREAPSSTRP